MLRVSSSPVACGVAAGAMVANGRMPRASGARLRARSARPPGLRVGACSGLTATHPAFRGRRFSSRPGGSDLGFPCLLPGNLDAPSDDDHRPGHAPGGHLQQHDGQAQDRTAWRMLRDGVDEITLQIVNPPDRRGGVAWTGTGQRAGLPTRKTHGDQAGDGYEGGTVEFHLSQRVAGLGVNKIDTLVVHIGENDPCSYPPRPTAKPARRLSGLKTSSSTPTRTP